MKHLLSALPLVLAIAATAALAAAFVLDLRILSPDTLGLGAGLVTCLGLCSMSATDARSRCC